VCFLPRIRGLLKALPGLRFVGLPKSNAHNNA
jgi:hypothetical protein